MSAALDERLLQLETRIDEIDDTASDVRRELGDLHREVEGLRDEVAALRGAVDQGMTTLLDELRSRQAWTDRIVSALVKGIGLVAGSTSRVCESAGHKVLVGLLVLVAILLAGVLGVTVQWGDLSVGIPVPVP